MNLGQALIAGQITLAFLLLIGAGLFVRTLSKLQSLELGFNRENLLLMEINTQQAGYKNPAAIAFHEALRQRFETIPGVVNATLAAGGQLDGGTWGLQFAAPGSLTDGKINAPLLPVGPNYLTTMQIPILLGRDIREADGNRKPIAAVISQSFAKKHYGADSPLGRRLTMTFEGIHELEVVGGIFVREKGGGLLITGNNFSENSNYNIRVGDFNNEDVPAHDNWWGNNDPLQTIFDGRSEPDIGKVLFEPFRKEPIKLGAGKAP